MKLVQLQVYSIAKKIEMKQLFKIDVYHQNTYLKNYNCSIFIVAAHEQELPVVLPSITNQNGTQCLNGTTVECPSDNCNTAACYNGCIYGGCTRIGCNGDTRKDENQTCVLSDNNCKDGLKCVDQDDGCDNDYGRCVKSGTKITKYSLKNYYHLINFVTSFP